jgi:hypothetical protein
MGPVPHRYVVVVPPNAPETLAYLTESFKNVPDVEVIVDRRRPTATPARPVVERRASGGQPRTQEAFGCTLVRIAEPPPTSGAVIPLGPARLRMLPMLREG